MNTACCDESSRRRWTKPLARMIIGLILTPGLLSYLQLRRQMTKSEICIIGPSPSASSSSYDLPTGREETTFQIVTDSFASSDGGSTNTDGSSTNANIKGNMNIPPALVQESLSQMYGLYTSKFENKKNKKDKPSTFRMIQQHKSSNSNSNRYPHLPLLSNNWPSVHLLSHLVSPDSLFPSSPPPSNIINKDTILEYDNQKQSWCLRTPVTVTIPSQKRQILSLCSPPTNNPQHFPPSGLWTTATLDSHPLIIPFHLPISIQTSCPSPSTTTHLPPEKKNARRNRNLSQILDRPATTLLLTLNIYLAFRYWNDRVTPAAVAKIYSKLTTSPYELWRSYSGALAHFDVMHLGFNMMNLYSLGEGLEEGRGSIAFLFENVCLIVLTTIVMMGMFALRRRYTGDTRDQSTVGYSGVLFAWMVIVTMKLKQTCPVPFIPDLCFETYVYKGLKFNVSPLVQLLLAQMIMRRVSFVGHLAGIVCGFGLYWGMFPPALFMTPSVLIGGVLLVHAIVVQKIITIGVHFGAIIGIMGSAAGAMSAATATEEESYEMVNMLDEIQELDHDQDGDDVPNAAVSSNNSQNQGKIRTCKLLTILQKAMIATCLLSPLAFDITMTLSQIISTTFLYYGTKYYMTSAVQKGDVTLVTNTGIILRWSFVLLILVIITDIMSVASWCSASLYVTMTTIRHSLLLSVGFWYAVGGVIIRTAVNMWGVIMTVRLLEDLKEMKRGGGVFENVFGWVLNDARLVGDQLLAPIFNAFEGRGVSLGGAGHIPVGSMRDL